MANAVRGEVLFEADGRARYLVLDINALCEAESACGRRTDEMFAAIKAGGDLISVRALMWAGLRRRQPEITLFEAGDVVAELGIVDARLKVIEALAAAFPDREAGKAAENPPAGSARRGTGKNSTSAG